MTHLIEDTEFYKMLVPIDFDHSLREGVDFLHEIDFHPTGFTTRRVSIRVRERRAAPVVGGRSLS